MTFLAKEEDDRHSFGDSVGEADISRLFGSSAEEDKHVSEDDVSVGRPWFDASEMFDSAEEEDK